MKLIAIHTIHRVNAKTKQQEVLPPNTEFDEDNKDNIDFFLANGAAKRPAEVAAAKAAAEKSPEPKQEVLPPAKTPAEDDFA